MAKPAVAEPVEDTFSAVLPEGLTELEAGGPEPAEEGASGSPEAPVAEATAPPAAVQPPVQPPPVPAQPPLPPVAREERRKRKHYQGLWQKTQAELEELKRQDRARQPAGRFLFKPLVLTPEAVAKIRQQADTAEGLGAAVELAVGQVLQEINAQVAALSEHVSQEQRAALIDERALWSEELARSRHEDYDAVLEKSGIKAGLAIVNGQYADVHLARKILLSANPGELAYELASDKLDQAEEAEPESPPAPVPDNGRPAPVVAAQPPAAPAPAGPAVESEAERRGQARVLEAVTKGAERPKGIRSIPSGGPPARSEITVEYLDQLQDTNPDAYQALCAKNPGLKEFHLGGLTRGER